jgi:light-regulated signal transduction histidine kinase (bacteriophytochrome)
VPLPGERVDLALYRPEHVEKRVRRALARTCAPDAAALAQLVARVPRERAKVRRAVAVPVTAERRELAITKAIVDAHGGTIRVVDREGPGTTFHVELPAVNEEGSP